MSRSPVAADRQGLSRGVLAVAALGTAGSMGLATASVPSPTRSPGEMFAFGFGAALVGVLALRSLPLRRVVRSHVAVSVLLAGRLGVMWGGAATTLRTVAWLAVSVAALAVAAQLDHLRRPTAGPGDRVVPSGRAGRPGLVRIAGGVAVLAAGAALLGGPALAGALPEGAAAGDLADQLGWRRDNALAATEQLDMTSRPRLSDSVVFTVTADRASFWRTSVFDRWDGRSWTRTDDQLRRIDADGAVVSSPEDVAAEGGVLVRQQFRVEGSFANALPAAPSAIRVDAPSPVVQWPDGDLVVQIPLGRGATYTVESRVATPTEAGLRELAGVSVPQVVLDRYAAPPVASERTRELARQLAEGRESDIERVRAVEAWLGANTRYSLDAPLSPAGVDVVDHFLFTSRLGWCEQVASSMVVLLRSMGVPARLATGFVPGDRDPISGRYTVRERDAHAWTEVWFPGVGWVPFDPTAEVPLAGEADAASASGVGDGWLDAVGLAMVVVGVVALALDGLRGMAIGLWAFLARRLRRRGGRRRSRDAAADAALASLRRVEARLERLGEPRAGPRSSAETAAAYARRVAASEVGEADRSELVAVGVAADAARYGGIPLDEGWATSTIERHAATPVADGHR